MYSCKKCNNIQTRFFLSHCVFGTVLYYITTHIISWYRDIYCIVRLLSIHTPKKTLSKPRPCHPKCSYKTVKWRLVVAPPTVRYTNRRQFHFHQIRGTGRKWTLESGLVWTHHHSSSGLLGSQCHEPGLLLTGEGRACPVRRRRFCSWMETLIHNSDSEQQRQWWPSLKNWVAFPLVHSPPDDPTGWKDPFFFGFPNYLHPISGVHLTQFCSKKGQWGRTVHQEFCWLQWVRPPSNTLKMQTFEL